MSSVNENSLHSHLMEKKSGLMGQPYEREKKNSRSYFKFRKCCEKMYFVLMKIKMRASARAIEANICEISKKGEHTTENNSPFNNENFIRKGQGN